MTDLPPTPLPVFPLTGCLLLPGNWLPLNVFEPRYRNLVEDALDGRPYLGMIQPLTPRRDNAVDPERPPDPEERPPLYAIGCAGRIDRAEEQPDGRYHVLLQGVVRFRVGEELPLLRGYRRVVPEYGEFAADLEEPEAEVDLARLFAAVSAFGEAHGFSFDLDRLTELPSVAVVNGLATALPLPPAEKQALLETEGPAERERLLVSLLRMGTGAKGPGTAGGDDPPVVN